MEGDDDDGHTKTGPLGPVRVVPLSPLLWPPFTTAFIGSLPVLFGAELSFSVDYFVPLTSWSGFTLSAFTKHGVFGLSRFFLVYHSESSSQARCDGTRTFTRVLYSLAVDPTLVMGASGTSFSPNQKSVQTLRAACACATFFSVMLRDHNLAAV